MNQDQVIGPEEAERRISEQANRVARSIRICDQRYREYLEAEREFDRAWHSAYLDASDHPAHERKSIAELAVLQPRESDPDGLSARDRRDVADAARRYVDSQRRADELILSAWQSVSASVRATYQAAGRGEW